MNHQSDYGYALPQLEDHSKENCLRKAALCEELAKRYPESAERYARWAEQWRAMAEGRSLATLPQVSRASHYS